MPVKENATARNSNDRLAAQVRRALKSGRKMRLDAEGWYVDAETSEPIGPDPAIERPLTRAMLDRAEVRDGNKVIRRGRPPLGPQSKERITIRLDADIVAAYRKQGSGWQTRLNADLRRKLRLRAQQAKQALEP